ncbi:MAG: cytidylate kinase-like family protein [Lachnospiraceae bacterium]|nr:cytidylate kinase-like family protein [Lachnospiraceae bacterium]
MMTGKVIITIGRSFGSRGAEIGRKIAEKLGIPFYDKEILEEQVKNSGFTSEYLSSFDEKRSSSLLYSIFMNPESIMLQSGYGSTQPMDLAVQKVQFQTIHEIAEKGSCVIVGRRADQILKNDYNVLSVFINAADEDRINHVCERDGLTRKEAESKIKRMDRSRRSYYNYYGDSEWGEASNYDICLNSSVFGVEACADLIVHSLKAKGYVE